MIFCCFEICLNNLGDKIALFLSAKKNKIKKEEEETALFLVSWAYTIFNGT